MYHNDVGSQTHGKTRPDYLLDAGDRIIAELADQAPATQKRLTPAARLAGQQLELLQPVAFGPARGGGMFSGKYAMLPSGALVVVLANEAHVATMHLLPGDGFAEEMAECARQARDYVRENGCTPTGGAASAIALYIGEYGGSPGGETPAAPDHAARNVLVLMFSALPDAEIRQTLNAAMAVTELGYGLAVIALLGPGAKPNTKAACFPMLLPLAPCLDAAVLDAVEEGGRA